MEFDDENENAQEEKHLRRSRTALCQICGRPSMYTHYNVRSCEGCKQFFRRIVVGRYDYVCQKEGDCKVTFLNDERQMRRCASCRLDRCLLNGMNPMMVETKCDDEWKYFILRMNERKRQLLLGQDEPDPELQYLGHTVSVLKHLWTAMFELPIVEFAYKFERFEDLFGDRQNALSLHNSPLKSHPMLMEHDYPLEKNMIAVGKHPRFRIFNISSWLLAIGLLKTMPAFWQLTGQEQGKLVCFLVEPIRCLSIFYYSAQLGLSTSTYPDGIQSVGALFMAKKQFKEDRCLHALAEKTYTQPVQRFLETAIEEQEFGLLLAILCSSFSTSSDYISAKTAEMLYAEQVRYSGMLLRLVQVKCGLEKGAKRYADCLDLVNTALASAHNRATMQAYLGAIHSFNPFREADLPTSLLALPLV